MTAVGRGYTPGDKFTLPAGRSLRSLPCQEGQPVAGEDTRNDSLIGKIKNKQTEIGESSKINIGERENTVQYHYRKG